jgi:hypothetical protein
MTRLITASSSHKPKHLGAGKYHSGKILRQIAHRTFTPVGK